MGNLYCNPLNLAYTFQKKSADAPLFREASDPTIVYWKDKYWLFASMSGGIWVSDDLNNWEFHQSASLPDTDYAPDVCVYKDKMYFITSAPKKKCTILSTDDPLADNWSFVSEFKCGFNPHLFADGENLYLYYGCSTDKPICGARMDTVNFTPCGPEIKLISGDPKNHGFEIREENNARLRPDASFKKDELPFIEGPWVTKHEGKYYLQYAAPATNLNVYGDGVYISDSPLGPFVYQSHNPFCFKAGGFITGAGHGSTFCDKYGNYWHVATMRICNNDVFERRIGLFPCGFDKDGIMFCNTTFGDYPTLIPQSNAEAYPYPPLRLNLLSYNKPVSTSSKLDGTRRMYIADEDIRTFWQAEDTDTAPWILLDLRNQCDIYCLQINFADVGCEAPKNKIFSYHGSPNARRDLMLADENYEYSIEISNDSKDFYPLTNVSSPNPHEFLTMSTPIKARYLLVKLKHMPFGGKFAVSGIRVFGASPVAKPDVITNFSVVRQSSTSAVASWSIVPGATGYNIRWGIAPDKLYSSVCLYSTNKYEMNFLNSNQKYYFMIEAFGEAGQVFGNVCELE